MEKRSKKANEQFKATIVLCCMVALISMVIGGLGVYFYMEANKMAVDTVPYSMISKI